MERLPQVRAGDADRERAATDLREHFAAGRLSEAELDERLDRAYAATTIEDLDALRADLPDPRPLPVPPSARAIARRRIYQDAGAMVILDIGCVAVWAATGASGSFWPVWVIVATGLRLVRDAWRLLGPAPEPTGRGRDRHRRRR